MESPQSLSFFVKVDGQSYSGHRNPQGVYKVDVMEERSVAHSACAALNVAKDMIPFLNENIDSFTLRVFRSDGREVQVPRPLSTSNDLHGCFAGRAANYPDIITLQ